MQNGPWKKHLESINNDLTNKPIFGFYNQEELLNVINYSDLYVHASDAEIEAISCMEAFTCGLVPVISNSTLVATKDFALEDINLFEHGNSNSLKDRIDYFIENPKVKDELSKRYLEYAKKYALDNCVSELEEVFRKVAKNKKTL